MERGGPWKRARAQGDLDPRPSTPRAGAGGATAGGYALTLGPDGPMGGGCCTPLLRTPLPGAQVGPGKRYVLACTSRLPAARTCQSTLRTYMAPRV